jgi:peptide/nickel transport system permease protein
MTTYLVRRLLQSLFLLIGVAVVTFVLIHVAPGDPIVALAGEDGDAGYYAMMRQKFGLDRPLWEQLLIYLGNLLRGELGFSYRYSQPALAVIGEHLGATLLLMLPALVIAVAVGITLGSLAAARAHTFTDVGVTLFAVLGDTVPVFWLAQVLLLLFALRFDLFPVQGMVDVRARYQGLAYGLDLLHHMALPVGVLSVQYLAPIARITRASVLEVLHMPYIQTAQAKGFSQPIVLLRHALPNALLPVVTLIGGQVGFMLAGAVLTETVFAWPGLGRVLLSAMLNRDFAVINALFLIIATGVILTNLAVDLLYTFLDPRVRVNE